MLDKIYERLEALGEKTSIEMLKFRADRADTVEELAEVLQTGKGMIDTLEMKKTGQLDMFNETK